MWRDTEKKLSTCLTLSHSLLWWGPKSVVRCDTVAFLEKFKKKKKKKEKEKLNP